MTEKYTTNSQAETERLGKNLAKRMNAGDVIAFFGGLGAGKTALCRGILRGLGYIGDVTSPTFSIVNEYRGGMLDAAHFDMYRIQGEQDLYSTGFYDYLDGRFVVLIEWSENITFALEDSYIQIEMDEDENMENREITVEGLRQ